MYKDGRHLELTSKDFEQLENFFGATGSHHKITTKNSGSGEKTFRIQFSDSRFYNFLLKVGVTPAKSLTLGSLNIDDEFIPDFVRGYLDGDGSIQMIRSGPYRKRPMFRTVLYSHSPLFLTWLRNQIRIMIGPRGSIGKNRLIYMRRESQQLLKHLYKNYDCICLSRKRQLAQKVLALPVDACSTRKEFRYE